VLLRRLSNSDYTYTVRDLTGVDSLDPLREFPVDSAEWLKANNFFFQQLSYLANKLDAIQEGERTALDNSMIMMCSSMLIGGHDASQPPVIIVGGDGGKLKGGRVLDYSGNPHRQMCSLFLSLMDKFDIRLDRFGDSATRLPEI
jgi:hypothetical protein